MLVLGVDPGTAICGYGLVELKGSRLRAVAYGAILTPAKMEMPSRLQMIYQKLRELIETYHPQIMGVEQLFFNKNVKTAMSVSQARGVILLAGAESGVPIVEYTPLQVKQAVVGYGSATKEQVIYMTEKLLQLPGKPSPDDVADALAIGICTAHSRNQTLWAGVNR